MLDANPGLGAQELKARLMATAEDWGPAGVDPDYGAGRLDAYAALRAAGAALHDPPPLPVHERRSGTLTGTGDVVEYPLTVCD